MVSLRRVTRIALAVLAFLAIIVPPAAQSAPAPTIVSVSVEGNTHVPTDRILAVVSAKVGDPFDPAKVQNDLRAIADLGWFADQAPPIIKDRPDGVAITYRVIENPVITSIRFEGNKAVSADTLQALMDTAVGQVFNIKTYQQDVLKINSYYDKIGFGGQVATHVTGVDITPQGVLTLKLTEGLTVKDVKITGDRVLPDALIKSALQVKAGTPYSEEARDKDVERLRELYKQYDLQIGNFEAGIDPATIDQKAGTADVTYQIDVARVGAIEITGNTLTHDDVIRRELRLHPGDVITESGLRRDYERLNNLGFFEKVDVNGGAGPDPKRPQYLTLKWTVKEQRTGTAQVGAGYSGGLTGTGLTGNLAFSQNNLNGTGNGGTIRLERGARYSNAQLQFTIPYLGKTEKSQKYSLGATLYTQAQTNYYPVYYATPSPNPSIGPTPVPSGVPVPVTIVPVNSLDYTAVSGVAATYKSRSTGLGVTIGRRLTDIYRISLGGNVQQVAAAADIPAPYVFPTAQPLAPLAAATSNPLTGGDQAVANAYGILAPSIAQIDSTRPYKVRSLTFGAAADSRDDIFSPRRGTNASIADEVSGKGLGSDFNYSIITLDAARYLPVLKTATFALHTRIGTTTGAIPTNKLFTFSDQDLRGYSNPFYGTNIALFQAELRIPLTPDRKVTFATFAETGGTRIRGGTALDGAGNAIDLNKYTFHSDVGVGIRFDVPQLGLKTLRLDFAKGSQGTHTSFGIGQSF